MRFLVITSITGFGITVVGVFVGFRAALPSHFLPRVEARLTKVRRRLDEAEAMNAIPRESEYRNRLASYDTEFRRIRLASNLFRPFLKQLWLPYYLYQLSSKIMVLQREVEVVIDENTLALVAQNATAPPAAINAIPMVNIAEPAPLPAAHSRLTYPSQLIRASQMAMDEHPLTPVAYNQNGIAIELPAPAATTASPMVNVAEPTPPPRAARSRLAHPSQLMRASQMAVDGHLPASDASNQSATALALPTPAAMTATPANNVAGLTDLIPDAYS